MPTFKSMIGPIQETLVPLIADHFAPALEKIMPSVDTLMKLAPARSSACSSTSARGWRSCCNRRWSPMPTPDGSRGAARPEDGGDLPRTRRGVHRYCAEAMVEPAVYRRRLDLLTGITVVSANVLEAAASAFVWIALHPRRPDGGGARRGAVDDVELTTLDWDSARALCRGLGGLAMEAWPRLVNWLIEQWNRLDFSIDVDLPDFMGGGFIRTPATSSHVNAGFGTTPVPRAPNPVTSTQAASRGPGIRAFHEVACSPHRRASPRGTRCSATAEAVFTPGAGGRHVPRRLFDAGGEPPLHRRPWSSPSS